MPSSAISKGFGLLHEIKDQSGILAGLTKHATMVNNGKNAASQLRRVGFTLQRRPRPVGIEVPVNIWTETAEAEDSVSSPSVIAPHPDHSSLDTALDLIHNSKDR